MVAPWDWDEHDQLVAVAVSTADGKDHVIRSRAIVKKLSRYLDRHVEASGMLTEDEFGGSALAVTRFSLIADRTEWDDDPDEDEDEWADDYDDLDLDRDGAVEYVDDEENDRW